MSRYDRAQRDAMARGKGYRNYYDYRVHAYGRIKPGATLDAAERRIYSGHAGMRELTRLVSRPRNRPLEVQPAGLERGPGGRWRTVLVVCQMADGRKHRFYLRGKAASQASLKGLKDLLANPGSGAAARDAFIASRTGGDGGGEPGDDEPGDGELDLDELDDLYDLDEYDFDYDFEPIPYIAAASIDVFAD